MLSKNIQEKVKMTGMKLIETKSIFFVRKYSGECKIDRNDIHDEAFYIFFVNIYSGESKNDRNEIEKLIEATSIFFCQKIFRRMQE